MEFDQQNEIWSIKANNLLGVDLTKISINRLKKDWAPPLPISSVMVLFIHYLIYKTVLTSSIAMFSDDYKLMAYWGTQPVTDTSLITITFYIYVLLIGYILVEAWSEWHLFSRIRNIIIYGMTLTVAIEGLIALELIRRFYPID